jgi:hypothetical protein
MRLLWFIQRLIAARFDTVGEVLFGVQVSTDTAVHLSSEEDWQTATMHSRNLLLKAVGQEGYNLVGSRLMQFGYLQRDAFLASVREEAARRAALEKYLQDEADGSTERE